MEHLVNLRVLSVDLLFELIHLRLDFTHLRRRDVVHGLARRDTARETRSRCL